jgi:hypothetical protein
LWAVALLVPSLPLSPLTAGVIALRIALTLIIFRFYEAPMRRWLSPAPAANYRLRPAASRRSIASE